MGLQEYSSKEKLSKGKRSQILRLEEIPPLPSTHRKLTAVMGDDSIDIQWLANTIEEDPSITARIIGLANSAYFRPRKKIVTVRDAIIHSLGMNMVQTLTSSLLLSGSLDTKECKNFCLETYWKQALGTAQCSQVLARKCQLVKPNAPEDAYLCGLLYSFGQLLLAHLYPSEMDKVLELQNQNDNEQLSTETILENEQTFLGIDHCQTGVCVATRWHLPEQVKTVMQYYVDPTYQGEYWDLSLLIGFVSQYIRSLGYPERNYSSKQLVIDKLAISAADMETCLDEFLQSQEGLLELAGNMVKYG